MKTLEDLVGRRFGKLLVVEGLEPNSGRRSVYTHKKYRCMCDCGTEKILPTNKLINRNQQSCGCGKREAAISKKLQLGQQINNLMVVKYVFEKHKWEVLCKCGHTAYFRGRDLNNNSAKSCGNCSGYLPYVDILYPGCKIHKFTVVGFDWNRHEWKFLCECGNDYFNRASVVLSGNTKSCGCSYTTNYVALAIVHNKQTNPDPKDAIATNIWCTRYSDGNLDYKSFLHLIFLPCTYCGVVGYTKETKEYHPSINLSKLPMEDRTLIYNGIDKIDPNGLHDKSNCTTACWICNHAKSIKTVSEFNEFIAKLINHEQSYSFESYRKLARFIDTSLFDNEDLYALHTSIRYVYARNYSDGDLSLEQFYQLSQLDCFYCGKNHQNSNYVNRSTHYKKKTMSLYAIETGYFRYNGLDQIIPSAGHTYNNVIPCCYDCNYAKDDLTVDEFYTWINRLQTQYK